MKKKSIEFIFCALIMIAMAYFMMLSTGCSSKRVLQKDCKDAQFENFWICKKY